MAEWKLIEKSLVEIIPYGSTAALASAGRKAADYDNGANLYPAMDLYLRVQFTVAPSAGVLAADVFRLIGDGEASEKIPTGGDGTVGTNVTPAQVNRVGSPITVSPSTSVDDVMFIPAVRLGPGTNRFVIVNLSAQEFKVNVWGLYGKPVNFQIV